MTFGQLLDAWTASPYLSVGLVLVLLFGGAWILVGSAQRRRD